MFFTAIAVAAGLLLWAALTGGRFATRFAAIGVPLCTAILVVFYLCGPPASHGEGYGSTRVALHDISFPVGTAVELGGDPKRDALLLADAASAAPAAATTITRKPLPAGLATITSKGEDLILTLKEGAVGLIAVKIGPDDGKLLGATEQDGVPACGSTDPRTCTTRQYFKEYLRKEAPKFAVCALAGPNKDKALTSAQAGRLYDTPGFGWMKSRKGECGAITGGAVFRAGSSPLMQVDDRTVRTPASLPPGARLRIWELVAGPRVPDKLAPEPGRARLALDVTVERAETGRILLKFVREQVRTFPVTDKMTSPILLATSATLAEPTKAFADAAVFGYLGAVFEADFESLEIARPGTSGGGLKLGPYAEATSAGDMVTVGAADRAQARVSVRRVAFDSGGFAHFGWLGLAALLASWCASVPLRWRVAGAAVLFGILDLLLAVRLLIAVEGAVVDPGLAAQTYPSNTVLAMLAAPAALLLAWRHWPVDWPATPRWQWAIWLVGGVAAAVSLILLCKPPPTGDALAATAGLLALGVLVRLAGIWRNVPERVARWSGGLIRRPLWTVAALLVVIAGLRLASGGEQIPILGNRVALSLVFVPLTLFAAALLFTQVAAARALDGRRPLVAFAVLIVGGIGVASYAVNDTGFAVLIWPVACGAFVVWSIRVGGRAASIDAALATALAATTLAALVAWLNGWLAAPVAAVATVAVALVVALPLLLVIVRRRQALWPTPAIGIVLLTVTVAALAQMPFAAGDIGIAEANAVDLNNARLLGALAPGRLAAVGTRAAQEFDGVIAVMRAYAVYGPGFGAGYLDQPEPRVLIDTHLTDHAAAVHLLYPFGRAGAAMLLLVPAVTALYALRRVGPRDSTGAWFGLLAAFTLFLTTAYMILANIGALPFTGRNMYLLAPLSSSDLLEGWLLIAITGWALGGREVSR